ncbi:MAG: stage II sporulation protein M [Candidatus Hydrogenedentota bacterium]
MTPSETQSHMLEDPPAESAAVAGASFIERARPQWEELEELLARARRRGLKRLSADELSRLDRLYRLCTIHLAQVQTRGRDPNLTAYLNTLVARAHSFVYISPRPNPLKRVLNFYVTGFARTVARTWLYHAVALVLLLIGVVAGHFATELEPRARYALMMPGDVRLPGSTPEQLQEMLLAGRDMPLEAKFAFTTQLFAHNTQVGWNAFVAGILVGVPTVLILVYNGGILGAFTAMHHRHGIVEEVWAWLLPHGVTEFLAIILCGGAGFLLGMAVVRPGLHGRKENVRAAGRECVRLAMGVIPLFIIAALAEGFLRQSELGTSARLIFAAGTALFWLLYFTRGYVVEQRVRREQAREAGLRADERETPERIRAGSSL